MKIFYVFSFRYKKEEKLITLEYEIALQSGFILVWLGFFFFFIPQWKHNIIFVSYIVFEHAENIPTRQTVQPDLSKSFFKIH